MNFISRIKLLFGYIPQVIKFRESVLLIEWKWLVFSHKDREMLIYKDEQTKINYVFTMFGSFMYKLKDES